MKGFFKYDKEDYIWEKKNEKGQKKSHCLKSKYHKRDNTGITTLKMALTLKLLGLVLGDQVWKDAYLERIQISPSRKAP